jgi:hypothetical protein
MTTYREEIFTDERIYLDKNDYWDCKFKQCKIIFDATGPVVLKRPTLIDCQFVFEGPAEKTLQFMRRLYAGEMGPMGQKAFRELLYNLQDPPMEQFSDS